MEARKKRIWPILTAVIMSLALLLTGCGADNGEEHDQNSDQDNAGEENEYKDLAGIYYSNPVSYTHLYGLDGSNWSQYVRYIQKLLTGDLGNSYQAGSPKVSYLIGQRLPWTLVLSVASTLISLFFGILIGARCAARRGGWGDRALLNASTITTAVPSFFIALMLSCLLGVQTEVFPADTDQNMGCLLYTSRCV